MADPREIVKVVFCASLEGSPEIQDAFKVGPQELAAKFYGELPSSMLGNSVRITVEKITDEQAGEWLERLLECKSLDGFCYFRRESECVRDGRETP